MNTDNHFKKLYSWMLGSQKFDSPAELLFYAICYSYPGHQYKGSITHLAKLMCCSESTVKRIAKALNDKGAINKVETTCAKGRAVIYKTVSLFDGCIDTEGLPEFEQEFWSSRESDN